MRLSYVSLGLSALALVSALPSPEDNQGAQQNNPTEQQHVLPQVYSGGEAIYYLQQGQYGSCMEVHENEEFVVAISYKLQGSYMPPPHCGREIEITNVGGGQDNNDAGHIVRAKVVDTCLYCDTEDLELSVGAFQALKGGELNPLSNFTVNWRFV